MAMLNNQMVCFFEKGIWWYPWLPYFWLLVSIVYKGWGSVSQAEIISPWCWPIGTPHLFVSKNNWLVVWNHGILWLSIYWECHHPNWRTHIFQRGRYTTNQLCHFSSYHFLISNFIPEIGPLEMMQKVHIPISNPRRAEQLLWIKSQVQCLWMFMSIFRNIKQ
jgi:hypothetical protein